MSFKAARADEAMKAKIASLDKPYMVVECIDDSGDDGGGAVFDGFNGLPRWIVLQERQMSEVEIDNLRGKWEAMQQ